MFHQMGYLIGKGDAECSTSANDVHIQDFLPFYVHFLYFLPLWKRWNIGPHVTGDSCGGHGESLGFCNKLVL